MLRTNGHQIFTLRNCYPSIRGLQLPIHVFTRSLDTSWMLFYLPISCPGLLKERERHRSGCACPIFAFYLRLGTGYKVVASFFFFSETPVPVQISFEERKTHVSIPVSITQFNYQLLLYTSDFHRSLSCFRFGR